MGIPISFPICHVSIYPPQTAWAQMTQFKARSNTRCHETAAWSETQDPKQQTTVHQISSCQCY